MTPAFGEIRSAIHSSHTLPDGWRYDPTIRRYVLDCLRGRELHVTGADTSDDLWRDASAITVGPITYTGDDMDRLRHWLVSWEIESDVLGLVEPDLRRPLLDTTRVRRDWALRLADDAAWSLAARSAARHRRQVLLTAPRNMTHYEVAEAVSARHACDVVQHLWHAQAEETRPRDIAYWRTRARVYARIGRNAIARLTALEYEHALLAAEANP